jgi:glutamyl-tRNA synthetase
MLAFLFTADESLAIDPAVAPAADTAPVLAAATAALDETEPFEHAEIEAALRKALIEDLGLKPKLAFGPVRAAVTGKRISPPLFESLELLGKPSALARLAAAAATVGA